MRKQSLLEVLSKGPRPSNVIYEGNKISAVNSELYEIGKIPSQISVSIDCLYISNNYLNNLDGVNHFQNLEILSASNNMIKYFEDICELKSLLKLKKLSLLGNSICRLPFYREFIIGQCPSLTNLDAANVSDLDVVEAKIKYKMVCNYISKATSNVIRNSIFGHFVKLRACHHEFYLSIIQRFRSLKSSHIGHRDQNSKRPLSETFNILKNGGVFQWAYSLSRSYFGRIVQNELYKICASFSLKNSNKLSPKENEKIFEVLFQKQEAVWNQQSLVYVQQGDSFRDDIIYDDIHSHLQDPVRLIQADLGQFFFLFDLQQNKTSDSSSEPQQKFSKQEFKRQALKAMPQDSTPSNSTKIKKNIEGKENKKQVAELESQYQQLLSNMKKPAGFPLTSLLNSLAKSSERLSSTMLPPRMEEPDDDEKSLSQITNISKTSSKPKSKQELFNFLLSTNSKPSNSDTCQSSSSYKPIEPSDLTISRIEEFTFDFEDEEKCRDFFAENDEFLKDFDATMHLYQQIFISLQDSWNELTDSIHKDISQWEKDRTEKDSQVKDTTIDIDINFVLKPSMTLPELKSCTHQFSKKILYLQKQVYDSNVFKNEHFPILQKHMAKIHEMIRKSNEFCQMMQVQYNYYNSNNEKNSSIEKCADNILNAVSAKRDTLNQYKEGIVSIDKEKETISNQILHEKQLSHELALSIQTLKNQITSIQQYFKERHSAPSFYSPYVQKILQDSSSITPFTELSITLPLLSIKRKIFAAWKSFSFKQRKFLKFRSIQQNKLKSNALWKWFDFLQKKKPELRISRGFQIKRYFKIWKKKLRNFQSIQRRFKTFQKNMLKLYFMRFVKRLALYLTKYLKRDRTLRIYCNVFIQMKVFHAWKRYFVDRKEYLNNLFLEIKKQSTQISFNHWLTLSKTRVEDRSRRLEIIVLKRNQRKLFLYLIHKWQYYYLYRLRLSEQYYYLKIKWHTFRKKFVGFHKRFTNNQSVMMRANSFDSRRMLSKGWKSWKSCLSYQKTLRRLYGPSYQYCYRFYLSKTFAKFVKNLWKQRLQRNKCAKAYRTIVYMKNYITMASAWRSFRHLYLQIVSQRALNQPPDAFSNFLEQYNDTSHYSLPSLPPLPPLPSAVSNISQKEKQEKPIEVISLPIQTPKNVEKLAGKVLKQSSFNILKGTFKVWHRKFLTILFRKVQSLRLSNKQSENQPIVSQFSIVKTTKEEENHNLRLKLSSGEAIIEQLQIQLATIEDSLQTQQIINIDISKSNSILQDEVNNLQSQFDDLDDQMRAKEREIHEFSNPESAQVSEPSSTALILLNEAKVSFEQMMQTSLKGREDTRLIQQQIDIMHLRTEALLQEISNLETQLIEREETKKELFVKKQKLSNILQSTQLTISQLINKFSLESKASERELETIEKELEKLAKVIQICKAFEETFRKKIESYQFKIKAKNLKQIFQNQSSFDQSLILNPKIPVSSLITFQTKEKESQTSFHSSNRSIKSYDSKDKEISSVSSNEKISLSFDKSTSKATPKATVPQDKSFDLVAFAPSPSLRFENTSFDTSSDYELVEQISSVSDRLKSKLGLK